MGASIGMAVVGATLLITGSVVQSQSLTKVFVLFFLIHDTLLRP